MIQRNRDPGRPQAAAGGEAGPRSGHLLPDWRHALVVVAHPDDETFGLGAIADSLATGGAAVHVLCFTHGEASQPDLTDRCLVAAAAAAGRLRALALAAATRRAARTGRIERDW